MSIVRRFLHDERGAAAIGDRVAAGLADAGW
jgi:Flp pilus assembly pilin Flp